MLTELLQQGIDSGGFLIIQGTSSKHFLIGRCYNDVEPNRTESHVGLNLFWQIVLAILVDASWRLW